MEADSVISVESLINAWRDSSADLLMLVMIDGKKQTIRIPRAVLPKLMWLPWADKRDPIVIGDQPLVKNFVIRLPVAEEWEVPVLLTKEDVPRLNEILQEAEKHFYPE